MTEENVQKAKTFSRRKLLKRGIGAAALYGLAAGSVNGQRAEESTDTTFVFVHGTHSSASAWTWIAQQLNLLGHRTHAVNLPGHGPAAFVPPAYQAPQDLQKLATVRSPLAELTLDDYVEHVIDVITQLKSKRDTRIVLVGHSQGGVTIGQVGSRIPDLLEHIVYVGAFCLIDLPTVSDYLYKTPEGSKSLVPDLPYLGDPAKLGVARVNWRSADPRDFRAQKLLVAASYSDDQFRVMLNDFQLDEPLAIATTPAQIEVRSWGSVNRTYVRLAKDRTIPFELQERMIAEANRVTSKPFAVHTLDTDHFVPSMPELVTILAALSQRAPAVS